MILNGLLQIAVTLLLVFAAAAPLGRYVQKIIAGERVALAALLSPLERAFYRLAGVDPAREQSWLAYAMSMLAFSLAGFLSLYALQRLQQYLPLNPRGFDGVAPDLAFNTSVSFVTNTNWQNYSGETTMSHLTQMLGLTVHNFVSAATGLAMAFALTRGFSRASSPTVGNFWVDMTRSTLYLLLPISTVVAIALVALGVPQTLAGAVDATTNMQAVALEHLYHRPILPSFHGSWTLGGFLGSALALAMGDLPIGATGVVAVLPLLEIVRENARLIVPAEGGRVSTSIGLAGFESGAAADEMLHRADQAMYAAKQSGKDRVAEYERLQTA